MTDVSRRSLLTGLLASAAIAKLLPLEAKALSRGILDHLERVGMPLDDFYGIGVFDEGDGWYRIRALYPDHRELRFYAKSDGGSVLVWGMQKTGFPAPLFEEYQ
jgi:hypothetical protein